MVIDPETKVIVLAVLGVVELAALITVLKLATRYVRSAAFGRDRSFERAWKRRLSFRIALIALALSMVLQLVCTFL